MDTQIPNIKEIIPERLRLGKTDKHRRQGYSRLYRPTLAPMGCTASTGCQITLTTQKNDLHKD